MGSGARRTFAIAPRSAASAGLCVVALSALTPAAYLLLLRPNLPLPEHRFVVPGSVRLVTETGDLRFYVESRSTIDDRSVEGPGALPGLRIEVTDDSGANVPVVWDPDLGIEDMYMTDDFAGQSVASAAVAPGSAVTVRADTDADADAASTGGTPVLAVATAAPSVSLTAIFIGLFVAFGVGAVLLRMAFVLVLNGRVIHLWGGDRAAGS